MVTDRFDRIENLLGDLRSEVAEMRAHTEHIMAALDKQNGRVSKSEARIEALEKQAIEAHATWKVIAGICTLVGSAGAWIFEHLVRR